jgi:trk system potassium uptake protein TrkH
MNFRYVVNQFAMLLVVLAGVMIAMVAAFFGIESAMDHEIDPAARSAFLVTAGVGLLVGGVLWYVTRRAPKTLGRREALLLVAVTWVIGAAFAALPAFLWANTSESIAPDQPFRHFVDCYFEAMSGLTTTGATVLADIEAVPHSLLLWRAMMHWLGGLGIVVLFVAVLPSLGVGGKKLYRVEAAGPKKQGLQPQIRETARVLWYIYLGLTVAQIAALKIVGMGWFDTVCHAFSTVATGGFSTRTASVGAYDQSVVRLIIIAFMVLGGVNFGLYYQIIRGRTRVALGDVELRLYLTLLVIGSALVFLALLEHPITSTDPGTVLEPTKATALGEAVFTTVSIQTTTGFATSDSATWPFLAQGVLVLLMFVGGCAGSTSGGIKVIRIWIVFKVMISEIERVFRPNVVRTVRVGGGKVDTDVKLLALSYTLGIVILFVAGSGAVMLLEQANPDSTCDYTTAATASVASLLNIGPGLAGVGAVENYGWLAAPTKCVLCVLMALGRLEVFAIIVLFTPRFWRAD